MGDDDFGELFAYGKARVQRRHRLLVDDTDAAAAQAAKVGRRHAGDILVAVGDAAGSKAAAIAEMPEDGHRQGGFAAAGFADQPQALARPQGEGHVIDGAHRPRAGAEIDADAIEREDRVRHGAPARAARPPAG